jgi:molybdopterin molybdotransferase
MDGFALRGADLGAEGANLRLAGSILAGDRNAPTLTPGTCMRITTGAPLPSGADTVVIKETARVEDDTVVIPAATRAGDNVRAAGEDMPRGGVALRGGTRLGGPQIAVLAAFGQTQAQVRRAPRLAIFATGDELADAGALLQAGQIHDSNGAMLAAQARECGAEVSSQSRIRDDPEALRVALADAAGHCDVIVTAGGVSMGEADFLPRVLAAHGRVHFWRVRIKPGMPILFGELADTLVFGLPGNPVSSAVCFHVFARAARAALEGGTTVPPLHARLRSAVRKRHDRSEFLRGRMAADQDGVLWFEAHAQQGSGQLRGLADANALARVPETVHDPAAGSVLEAWPLPGAWT